MSLSRENLGMRHRGLQSEENNPSIQEKKRFMLQKKIKLAPLWNSDGRIQTRLVGVSPPRVLALGFRRAQPTAKR